MGMIGHLRRLSADERAQLQRDPGVTSTLTKRPAKKDAAAIMVALRKVQQIGRQAKEAGGDTQAARQQILNTLADAGVEVPTMGVQSDGSLRLEKSWHVMHYILSGGTAEASTTPLSQALLGGHELGEDVGYGPARLLSPQQVAEISGALATVNIEKLAAAYDPSKAEEMQIYCADHETEEIVYWFGQIKSYYDEVAKSGEAMLLWID